MSDTKSGDAIHDSSREQLYDIVRDDGESLDDKRRAIVELGAEYLGVSLGFVSAIDTDAERFEVLVSTNDEMLAEGAVYDLSKTYCRRCVDTEATLAVSDALDEGWEGDPGYEEHRLGCYLGTPIRVDGEIVGTVCFADKDGRSPSFSSNERAFVELSARLLGREREIALYEQRLARREDAVADREEELAKTEQKYESLVTTAPDAIFIAEVDSGRIVEANDAAAELTGVPVDAIVDQNLRSFYPGDEDRYWAEFERFLLTGEGTMSRYSDGTHLELQRPDGTTVPFEVSASTVELDGTEYVQGIVRDVSERLEQEADAARQRRERERTEKKYESLIAAAPDAIVLADLESREFVEVNDAALELTGYEESELLGKTIEAIHPEARVEEYVEAFRSVVDQDDETRSELDDGTPILVERADGSTVPVEMSLKTVEMNGRTHALGIFRDISKRRERQRELRVMNRAIEEAPVGITIATSDRQDETEDENPLMYVNGRFEEMTGYTRKETLDRDCRFLQGPETDEDAIATLGEGVANENPVQTELLNYRKDGTPFWNDVSIAPVEDGSGNVSHFVGFQRDVTERKRQEQLVNVMNRVLRHNLRNGMNVVLNYSTELVERLDGENAEFARSIHRRASELVALGEQSRAINRAASTETTAKPRDVVPTVTHVADELAAANPDAEVSVSAPDSQQVYATETIQTAIRELGTNAVEHTGEAPTVEFEIERVDDMVEIRVSDDGPGLPDEERTVLDGGQETPLEHGSGLGLWFVNWVVTGVGGHVSVAVEDGTTVTVALRDPEKSDGAAIPRQRSAFGE